MHSDFSLKTTKKEMEKQDKNEKNSNNTKVNASRHKIIGLINNRML